MKYESTLCTRCWKNNFVLFCKNCGDLDEHDERIRRETTEECVERCRHAMLDDRYSITVARICTAIMGEAKK